MSKLYGSIGTGACAVKAALTEAGAPFEEVEIKTSTKQHLTEEYRQINPRQQVPSLMLPDGSIMTEGPAILLHIADAHPEVTYEDSSLKKIVKSRSSKHRATDSDF